jgi:hypothetical protein
MYPSLLQFNKKRVKPPLEDGLSDYLYFNFSLGHHNTSFLYKNNLFSDINPLFYQQNGSNGFCRDGRRCGKGGALLHLSGVGPFGAYTVP